ncbi:MAG: diaminopimelate decarboxylase, partial [bacterium]|nr:diaminopimelate decarboxylase [bacterium]
MKSQLISRRQAEMLMKKHGSPLYVYRKSVVKKRYNDLIRSIRYPHTKIYYACKANANLEILALLKKLGASIECVSRGEVEQALRAGF